MLRTVEIQQGVTGVRILNGPVTYSPETWTELGVCIYEEETHNSPDMSKSGSKHSTQRLPELRDIPKCNRDDIYWYIRMSTDPPVVDLKD